MVLLSSVLCVSCSSPSPLGRAQHAQFASAPAAACVVLSLVASDCARVQERLLFCGQTPLGQTHLGISDPFSLWLLEFSPAAALPLPVLPSPGTELCGEGSPCRSSLCSLCERLQELKPSVGVYFPVEKHRFCSVSKRQGLPTFVYKAKMLCGLEEFRDLSSLLLCFVTFNGLPDHLVFPSNGRS